MVASIVLVIVNCLVWGGWALSFATKGTLSLRQAAWYVYGPSLMALVILLGTAAVLVSRRGSTGQSGSSFRWTLIATLIAFLPYACVSGGGV